MSEFGPGAVQRLLCHFALGHVLERADEQRTPGNVLDDMRDSAHMLDRARDGHDAERKGDVLTRHAACNHRFKRRQVVRVDDVSNPLYRDFGSGFELEDAKGFLRPV